VLLGKYTRGYYSNILGDMLRRWWLRNRRGFRAERDAIVPLFTVRYLSEKYLERNRTLDNNFIDFKQAFDSI
jgi:hypothetical protein